VKIIFLFILISLSCHSLFADESKEEINNKKTLEEKLIQKNIDISEWFDSVADGIDMFFTGKRLTKKKNETNVTIENTTFLKERESVNNISSLNVNLRLPNLEEYWQLKFTSYDESKEKRNNQLGGARKTPRDRNYGATVGVFRKLGSIRTAFQPRIDLQDPLAVSHTLTFESIAEMKGFNINPKLQFFANSSQGTGIFTAINFNIPLDKTFSMTQVNNGEYEEKSHRFDVSNGISLGQSLSRSSSLSYNLFFDSNNVTEYHLETYTVSVGWNQMLYKNILSYQVIPYVEFSKPQGFKGVQGINFTLALNF
jgi:hypothetical protein